MVSWLVVGIDSYLSCVVVLLLLYIGVNVDQGFGVEKLAELFRVGRLVIGRSDSVKLIDIMLRVQ